jgi:hypothetical protein
MAKRFGKQYRIGEIGAGLLDGYFSKLYRLTPATLAEEENGIDRVAFRPDGRQVCLEYKTDILADKSGNAFIEVVAYDGERGQREGWAYTSRADMIVYFLPFSNRLLLIRPARLRFKLPAWEARYRREKVQNQGRTEWVTVGLLIPLEVLLIEKVAVLIDFRSSDHDYCKHVVRVARECLFQDADLYRNPPRRRP